MSSDSRQLNQLIEQLLTCSVCLEEYKNPKQLPCQHSFCSEPCLVFLVNYEEMTIKCPECRTEHSVPNEGIQTFPNNVTLLRLLDLNRNNTGVVPNTSVDDDERCHICTENASIERCSHCDRNVCEECFDSHIEMMQNEIQRINNQVNSGITQCYDANCGIVDGVEELCENSDQIKEEIIEIKTILDDGNNGLSLIYNKLTITVKSTVFLKHNV